VLSPRRLLPALALVSLCARTLPSVRPCWSLLCLRTQHSWTFRSSCSLIILELRDQGASTVRSYYTYVNLIFIGIRRKELCWQQTKRWQASQWGDQIRRSLFERCASRSRLGDLAYEKQLFVSSVSSSGSASRQAKGSGGCFSQCIGHHLPGVTKQATLYWPGGRLFRQAGCEARWASIFVVLNNLATRLPWHQRRQHDLLGEYFRRNINDTVTPLVHRFNERCAIWHHHVSRNYHTRARRRHWRYEYR